MPNAVRGSIWFPSLSGRVRMPVSAVGQSGNMRPCQQQTNGPLSPHWPSFPIDVRLLLLLASMTFVGISSESNQIGMRQNVSRTSQPHDDGRLVRRPAAWFRFYMSKPRAIWWARPLTDVVSIDLYCQYATHMLAGCAHAPFYSFGLPETEQPLEDWKLLPRAIQRVFAAEQKVKRP